MKISRIYVSGYRKDFEFTCCCIASIRHFYPGIAISLIKDYLDGDYDTRQLQRTYGVEIFETPVRRFGWGMAKLEPLFLPGAERCLILDSDTVFLGRVLDRLDGRADFIVEKCDHKPAEMALNYFDPSRVAAEFPDFRFPGYVFNTGQFVATTGILKRADFAGLIDFTEPRRPLREDRFFCGDQGVLNFVLFRKQQRGELSIRRAVFMEWPPALAAGSIAIRKLERRGYPLLLHWAGPKKPELAAHSLGEVLTWFAEKYRRDAAGEGFAPPPTMLSRLFRRFGALGG